MLDIDGGFYYVLKDGLTADGFKISKGTLNMIQNQALYWVNTQRKLRGLPTLRCFGKSIQSSNACCVLGQATGGLFFANGRATFFDKINGELVSGSKIQLPATVALFEMFFELGYYPELSVGQFPVISEELFEEFVEQTKALRERYLTAEEIEENAKLHAELSEQFEVAAEEQDLFYSIT